jgi:VWFA-related protein
MLRLVGLCSLSLCLVVSSPARQTGPSTGQSAAPERTSPIPLIPRSHEERERRYETQHRIILDVRVTDAYGNAVSGLKQDDFSLFSNGQAQKLVTFRAIEGTDTIAPARVMLMLDAVNNGPGSINDDRREIEKFLRTARGSFASPTSIAILSASGVRETTESRNPEALVAELHALTKDTHPFACNEEDNASSQLPPGATLGMPRLPSAVGGSRRKQEAACLNQRFQLSITSLDELAEREIAIPGRLILIWIGPGWPRLADRDFAPDSAALKQNFFDYLVSLSTAIREAQITLDSVFTPNLFRTAETATDQDRTFFDGVPAENETTAGSLSLQALAHQSGGLVLSQGRDVGAQIGQCAADAQSYYAMSFESPAAAQPAEFHSLHITVKKPELSVRSNTMYYAQP